MARSHVLDIGPGLGHAKILAILEENAKERLSEVLSGADDAGIDGGAERLVLELIFLALFSLHVMAWLLSPCNRVVKGWLVLQCIWTMPA